jgi:EAL domain-containing protein (putative c-di-GMP-specific phosphodiesterase class I)
VLVIESNLDDALSIAGCCARRSARRSAFAGTLADARGNLVAGDVDCVPVDSSRSTARSSGVSSDGARQRRLFTSVRGSRALGLGAVAEGVGTREQLEEVVRHGCDAVQGCFVCRPPRWARSTTAS